MAELFAYTDGACSGNPGPGGWGVLLQAMEGDTVVKGDLVAVLEAMKMEQPLTAHRDGTVGKIDAAVGTTVSAGHVLLSIND